MLCFSLFAWAGDAIIEEEGEEEEEEEELEQVAEQGPSVEEEKMNEALVCAAYIALRSPMRTRFLLFIFQCDSNK